MIELTDAHRTNVAQMSNYRWTKLNHQAGAGIDYRYHAVETTGRPLCGARGAASDHIRERGFPTKPPKKWADDSGIVKTRPVCNRCDRKMEKWRVAMNP